MGKKIALGCVVFALLGIVGSLGFYYFVIRPAKTYVTRLASLGDLSELNSDIHNQSSFHPPENLELTEEQVVRFVRVERQMERDLGQRLEELRGRFESRQTQGPGCVEKSGSREACPGKE